MSTTSAARKAPAKRLPAKAPAKAAPAKKAVAKKAPAKKATAPAAEKKTYTATARSGQVVFRQATTEMAFAVDVAEPDGTSAKAKAGRIWGLFATKEAATAAAERANALGHDAIITTCKAVLTMGLFGPSQRDRREPEPRWKVERERKARREAHQAQIEQAVEGGCGDCDDD